MPWEIWDMFRSKCWVKTKISRNSNAYLSRPWIWSITVMIFSFTSLSHHERCSHSISHVNWFMDIDDRERYALEFPEIFVFKQNFDIKTYPIFPRALGHIKKVWCTKTNPPVWAFTMPKDFRIRQPIQKLRGWLLITVSIGHSVDTCICILTKTRH